MSSLQHSVFVGLILLLTSRTAFSGERIDLSPRVKVNSFTHVTIQLEAGGHNLLRAGAADEGSNNDKDKAKTEDQKLPISVDAKLAYDERRLADAATTTETGALLAARYYDTAEAVIKVGDGGRSPKLPDDRRLIVLEHATQRPALYCADAPSRARSSTSSTWSATR